MTYSEYRDNGVRREPVRCCFEVEYHDGFKEQCVSIAEWNCETCGESACEDHFDSRKGMCSECAWSVLPETNTEALALLGRAMRAAGRSISYRGRELPGWETVENPLEGKPGPMSVLRLLLGKERKAA